MKVEEQIKNYASQAEYHFARRDAEKGDAEYGTLRDRSRLFNEAVQYYIEQKTLAELREKLKEGAICRAERDLGLVKF